MLPDRSKRAASADSPLPRLPLIRNRELLALAVVLVAQLYLIFPDGQLFTQLINRSPSSALNIAYLENLLRSDPGNIALRLRLAESRAEQGDYPRIDALLSPVERSGDTEQRYRALRIRLDTLSAARQLERPGLPAERVNALLRTLAETGDTPITLPQLATYALRLDQPELALQLYRRAASSGAPPSWLPEAAQLSTAHGQLKLAAELYLMARRKAPLPEARRYFMLGIESLIRAGLYEEALLQAERHLPGLDRDPQTLAFLIRTAQAANRPRLGADYARRLLALDPAYSGREP